MAQTFIEKRAGLAVDTLRGTRVSDEPLGGVRGGHVGVRPPCPLGGEFRH